MIKTSKLSKYIKTQDTSAKAHLEFTEVFSWGSDRFG